MENQIQNIAIAKTFETLPWIFVPNGHLYMNDHDIDAKTGEIKYDNPAFVFDSCVKIGDYCFTIEKNIANPLATRSFWVIGAFRGTMHFSFLKMLGDDMKSHRETFLKFLWQIIVPILYPEISESVQNKGELECEVVLFTKE